MSKWIYDNINQLISVFCKNVIVISFLSGSLVYADDFISEVESVFAQEEKEAVENTKQKVIYKKPPQTKRSKQINKISELVRLDTFSDIAVIQKRFLPKTNRFQLFGGALTDLNNSFFMSFGGNARLSYNFREKWGLELVGSFLSNSDRSVTKKLSQEHNIQASTFIQSKMFYGIDINWSPIYGKYSLFSRKIIPFDMYFSAGIGQTQVDYQGEAPSFLTYHLGTGQILASSKSFGLRWDVSWNFFNTDNDGWVHNIFLTVGASLFFPGSKYR